MLPVVVGQCRAVHGCGDVGHEDSHGWHLGTDSGNLRVLPDRLELGLFVGEAFFHEPAGQFQLPGGGGIYGAAALGLHGGEPDAGVNAGLHRGLHFLFMHQPEIVGHHDAVDPVQPRGIQQALLHVGMGRKAEEADLAFGLLLGRPLAHTAVHRVGVPDGMHEEEVDVVGIHPFQGGGQVTAHTPTASGGGFGDQEDLLPLFWVALEVLADALLAASAAVNMGRVPVGDPPADGLLEHGLVGGDVEHAPQGEDGDLDA